jgi:hypothetical protein
VAAKSRAALHFVSHTTRPPRPAESVQEQSFARPHSRYWVNDLEDFMGSQVPVRAARRLIASDRIEGTLVCRPDGGQIGTIERLMINKVSGQIAYAVVKVTGMPGLTERRFPLAWESLHYDRRRGAYLADVTEQDVRLAPSADGGFDWGERTDIAHIRPYRPPTFWGSSV